MAAFLEDSSFREAIDFVASLCAIGGLAGGSVALVARLIDRRFDLAQHVEGDQRPALHVYITTVRDRPGTARVLREVTSDFAPSGQP